jgi:hypothetical protein
VCNTDSTHEFFTLDGVPVTCASLFPTRQDAVSVPRGDIRLHACDRCAFVFNDRFDPRLADIGASYESSQAASAHFNAFANALAADWVHRYHLRGRTVLEVGCGNGDFLRKLLDSGIAAGIGIDPLAQAPANESAARLQMIRASFDHQFLHLQADALVCRHTLEHLQDVAGFLGSVREWALRDAQRVVLFEIPDAARIFAERAFWDVYYEHCNYFTADTLRHAFELAGFEVLRLEQVYDRQYLVVEAVARQTKAAVLPEQVVSAALATCTQFAIDVRNSVMRCESRLRELAAQGPLVLWQGASKTVGFLSALVRIPQIDAAIDLSVERHGKYLPGSGLPVHAPEELLRLQPRNVVLMNPVYLDEVRAHVRTLGLQAQVHPVNALLSDDGTVARHGTFPSS